MDVGSESIAKNETIPPPPTFRIKSDSALRKRTVFRRGRRKKKVKRRCLEILSQAKQRTAEENKEEVKTENGKQTI